MPQLLRLMLSVAGEEQSQCVYDIVFTTKGTSMTDAVCAGMAGLPRSSVDPLLLLTQQGATSRERRGGGDVPGVTCRGRRAKSDVQRAICRE